MRGLRFSLLLVGLVASMVVLAQSSTVRMSWQMGPENFSFRDAHLVAYPVAASDFEVPVRCAYLGDLDTYVWQFKADVPEKYRTGDWVLYGETDSQAVAFTFTIKNGTAGALVPVSWPVPTLADGANLSSVGFNPPAVSLQGITWSVTIDGKPVDNRTLDTTPATKARVYQLRGTLPGAPKAHHLTSKSVEVTPDEGSRT